MATAQMTLTANGSDLLCRLIFGGKQDLPGVFRVVEIDNAMADIAIQADRRKGTVLSIDRGTMTARTAIRKVGCMPNRIQRILR